MKTKSTPKDNTIYKSSSNTNKKRKERMNLIDLDAIDSNDEFTDVIDKKMLAHKLKKSRDFLLNGE